MAQIIIDIKDGYEIKVAKDFGGFQYDPKKVPPLEEHLLAIKSKIDEYGAFSGTWTLGVTYKTSSHQY